MNKIGWIILIVAFGGALAMHVLLKISLGLSLLIFFVGWPLLGTIVTIDDDLKGGWSNPDGSVRPPWVQTPFWGQIIGGLAISSVGAAIDSGWTTQESAWFWVLAVVGLAIAVPMIRRRFGTDGG